MVTTIPDDAFFDQVVTGRYAGLHEVEPRIHRDDFIFAYNLEGPSKLPFEDGVAYYFADGAQSAERLDRLIGTYLPDRSTGVRLLEFASGYGCVTRHLRKRGDRYMTTACDIHPQAVDFIRDHIGVDSVLSDRVPERLATGGGFDVVFALSFFTHMPPATFGRWLNALHDQVNDKGLLIFTTHGRVGQASLNVPSLGEAGFWFLAESEQRDLPTQDYGATMVRPHVVFEALSHRRDCTLVLFQEGFWWGMQDLYVYRKLQGGDVTNRAPSVDASAGAAEIAELRKSVDDLRAEIGMLRASTSWKLTRPLRRLRTFLRHK